MIKTAIISCLIAASVGAPQKDLPVLFQFKQPTHNVAVFRGADLKNAIAAGLVKGFGGAGAGASESAGAGKTAPVVRVAPVVQRVPVVAYQPAPVVSYKPAPLAYKPAPVVSYKPVPTPSPVVYRPAPKIVYQPKPAAYKPVAAYVDPYAGEPAVYNYNYAVKDDYTYNDFGASENRDGYLTQGKYVVALPDGRVQTVTYSVDGGAGYVADVTYEGVAQYPEDPAPGYSA